MMQDWSPDAMRFMRDAASRSDYHKRLAAQSRPICRRMPTSATRAAAWAIWRLRLRPTAKPSRRSTARPRQSRRCARGRFRITCGQAARIFYARAAVRRHGFLLFRQNAGDFGRFCAALPQNGRGCEAPGARPPVLRAADADGAPRRGAGGDFFCVSAASRFRANALRSSWGSRSGRWRRQSAFFRAL